MTGEEMGGENRLDEEKAGKMGRECIERKKKKKERREGVG